MYVDVEDVVNAAGNECRVNATGQCHRFSTLLIQITMMQKLIMKSSQKQTATDMESSLDVERLLVSMSSRVDCLYLLTVTMLLSAVGVLLFCEILS